MLARGVSLASRRVLRIAGEEAIPFLQRILTNDVRSLADAGAAPVYAALQNAQGRVRHDLFLHREFGGALLADLLKVLQNHKLMEAQNEGEAEAERVKAFLTATEGAVTNLDTRVGLWNVLRKQDALKAVSSGPARLYFTPSDVNLSIETKEAGLTESSTGSDL